MDIFADLKNNIDKPDYTTKQELETVIDALNIDASVTVKKIEEGYHLARGFDKLKLTVTELNDTQVKILVTSEECFSDYMSELRDTELKF